MRDYRQSLSLSRRVSPFLAIFKMTIRENNNDDDDDDEEELMRVFTWRVDGHEYKLPMKKILVCSSSQQSRLVVITVDVFNFNIVKKKN